MNNQQSNYPNGYAMTQSVSNNTSSQNVGYNNIQQFSNYGSGTQHNEVEDIKNILNNTQTQLQKYGNDIVNMQNMMSQMDFKKMYQTILDIPKVLVAQSQMPNRTMRSLNLIVSSADRDLSNLSFNKYNFKITFGAESNQTIVSYNNSYKTGGQIGRDISSTSVTYKSSGLLNPNIQQVIKNVISVKLKRVVIPKPRDNVFNPEPFYYVIIDELDSNIYATKTFSHKIFCKVVYDEKIKFYSSTDTTGREYLYYTNEDDAVAYYYPSPLAKLDRLSIKLVNGLGNTLDISGGFEDIDITTDTDANSDKVSSNDIKFYNNTFLKDNLFNVNTGKYSRIEGISGSYIYDLRENIGAAIGNTIINLSNQLEYVFEVKTVEFDVNSGIQPIL